MSDKLIESFLQMHNKKQIDEKVGVPLAARQKQQQDAANAKTTSNIMSREPTEAPSSVGTKISQGVGAAGAGLSNFVNTALMGKEVAAAGDYVVKNVGSALGVGKGTTWEKEYGQEKEKEARSKLNYPTASGLGTAAGEIANIASLAGLGKSAVKYGVKKLAGSADDVTKVARGIDGEITTAAPRPGFKDITPSSSTSVTRTATDVAPAARPTGPSTALSRPNSSSVGPAMRTVDDVPPRLAGPSAARALPSPSTTSRALGGFGKVPMGKVAAVGAGVGAGIAASTLGSSPAGETKAAPAPAASATTAPKPESYKVSKGDTLSDLAKKWNVSVADIAKANQGIKDVHKIGIGQELVKPAATGNPIYQGGIGTKAGPSKSQNIQTPKLKAESKEMTNKLIDAFMKLQATNSSNMFAEAKKVKKLDPVGKEDEDIDNDGDKDKSDSYLHNRRKKIASAMKEAKDPHAEGMVKAGTKAPEMTTDPDYAKKKPAAQTPNRAEKGSLPKGVTVKTNEEVEQIDEALSADHKKAVANHLKKMWGKGTVSFDKQDGNHFATHNDGIESQVHSVSKKGGKLHVAHFMTVQEEVEFSEAELAHIAAILEGPVAPTPEDHSPKAFGATASRSGTLSDETVAEEEVKRGRGRPKGSKSGSMHGSGTGEGGETKNLAAQIRFSRPSEGHFMLKHPKTGVSKAVPVKAATEFYSKYSGAEKPAEKEAHHDAFLAKHFGAEKPKVGITLPSMPKSKG